MNNGQAKAVEKAREKQAEAKRLHANGNSVKLIAQLLKTRERTVEKMLAAPDDKLWWGQGTKWKGKHWAGKEEIAERLRAGKAVPDIAKELLVSEPTIRRRIVDMGGIEEARKYGLEPAVTARESAE